MLIMQNHESAFDGNAFYFSVFAILQIMRNWLISKKNFVKINLQKFRAQKNLLNDFVSQNMRHLPMQKHFFYYFMLGCSFIFML